MSTQPTHHRSGVILIIVLVVIAMLALSAYTFTDLMIAHNEAANSFGTLAQSRALIKSGVSTTQAILLQTPAAQSGLGGTYNNPGLFYQQIVVPDGNPALQGMFSIVAPIYDFNGNPMGVRYGLQNESGKLNLNQLADFGGAAEQQAALMLLPGMTIEIADAIIDWLDQDDTPEPNGAELEYYSGLNPPYQPKNAALDSLNELLMVRGITPDHLYGKDKNRNGQLDQAELATQLMIEYDLTLGSVDLGWQAYLTVVSAESGVDPQGNAKIGLNSPEYTTPQDLYDALVEVIDADWAMFIVACRINNPSPIPPPPATQPPTISGQSIDFATASFNPNVSGFMNLVDAQVRIQTAKGTETVASPFTSEPSSIRNDLMKLMDYVTVADASDVVTPGKVNLNLAQRPVVAAVATLSTTDPITEEQLDLILNGQQPEADPVTSDRRHYVWPLAEGILNLDQMKEIEPLITGDGDIYSANIVGYFADGRHVSRANVIIDGTLDPSKQYVPVLQWEELTPLGRGFLRSELTGQVTDDTAVATP